MKVLIISTNQCSSPHPVLPAGACQVAEAVEKAGHSAALLDLMFEKDPVGAVRDKISQADYDVVGLSVRNIDNNDLTGTKFFIPSLLPVIRTIRSTSDAMLVLGGAAMGVMPQQLLAHTGIPYGITGDGEKAFCRLLEHIEHSRPCHEIPGLCFLEGKSFHANPVRMQEHFRCSIPVYDRWLDLAAYNSHLSTVPLRTKLGCGFKCVYCTYSKIEGGAYCLADPEEVASAAMSLAASGARDIEFVDNVFNAPYDHALRVCEALTRKNTGAGFQSVELNPAHFSDELVEAMERAGFTGIGLTVESASDTVLHALKKGFTAGQVHAAADILARHELPCVWIFMLGGPGETKETVRETLRFARNRIRAVDAAFFNIGVRIYPGTELEAIARREGVLTRRPEDMLEPVFYVSPGVDVEWIRNEVGSLLSSHMNFMSVDTFSLPYLALVLRIANRLGLRSPVWRYTAHIRRTLRTFGLNA